MSTEIFINGTQLHAPEAQVVHTYQANNYAEVQNRQANYTNRFKIPKTPHNVLTLDFLNFPGNTSDFPYATSTVTVRDGSYEVIREGKAYISQSDPDYYELFIIFGNSDLFDFLDLLTLSALDTSSWNHTHDASTAISSWTNQSTYIYALSNQGANISTNPDLTYNYSIYRSFPWLYVHSLMEKVWELAGIQIRSDWMASLPNTHKYYKLIISCGGSSLNYNSGGTFEINLHAPPIKLSDFVKGVLQIFALNIDLDRTDTQLNTWRIEPMQNVLSGVCGAVDWSRKFHRERSEKYNVTEFALRNIFKWQYDEERNPTGLGYGSWVEDFLNNNKLKQTATMIDHQFIITKADRTWDNVPNLLNTTFWWDGVDDFEANESCYIAVVETHTTITAANKITGSITQNVSSGTDIPVAHTTQLTWQILTSEWYPLLFGMNERAQLKDVEMNLDIMDILTLDFMKLVYLQQYGEYFYLNKIKNWRSGALCRVELIAARNLLAGAGLCDNPILNPRFEGIIDPPWLIALSGPGGQIAADPCVIDNTDSDAITLTQSIPRTQLPVAYRLYYKFEKSITAQTWTARFFVGLWNGYAWTSSPNDIEEGYIEFTPGGTITPFGISLAFSFSGEFNNLVCHYCYLCKSPFTP